MKTQQLIERLQREISGQDSFSNLQTDQIIQPLSQGPRNNIRSKSTPGIFQTDPQQQSPDSSSKNNIFQRQNIQIVQEIHLNGDKRGQYKPLGRDNMYLEDNFSNEDELQYQQISSNSQTNILDKELSQQNLDKARNQPNLNTQFIQLQSNGEFELDSKQLIHIDSDLNNSHHRQNLASHQNFEITEFQDNSKLSEETRRQMVLKIIQVKQYIQRNNIQCEFEVLEDSGMYLGLPDTQLQDIFQKASNIINSATQENLQILVESHEQFIDNSTGEILTKEQVQQRQKSKSQKIVIDTPNFEQKDQMLYMEAEMHFDFSGYSKETVQKMMLMIGEEMQKIQIGESKLSPDKQEALNGVSFLGYDVTTALSSDLTKF